MHKGNPFSSAGLVCSATNLNWLVQRIDLVYHYLKVIFLQWKLKINVDILESPKKNLLFAFFPMLDQKHALLLGIFFSYCHIIIYS